MGAEGTEEHTDMIRKSSGGYTVKSQSGSKKLGTYKTRGEAVKRLRQVEYFKSVKGRGK